MTEKKQRKGRFALGMLIYALIFALIVGIGLYVFWQFADSFEQSREKQVMARYMETLDREHIRAMSEAFVRENVDSSIQSEDASHEWIYNYVNGQLRCAKMPFESSSERQVYALLKGEEILGQVVLTEAGEGKFGVKLLEVTEESLSFEEHLRHTELTVPDGAKVRVGEVVLADSCITETGVHYELLHELYDHGAEFPTMTSWKTGNYLGEVPVSIILADGSELSYSGEYDELPFTENCSAETLEGLRSFIEKFLGGYVYFTSGAQGVNIVNYYAVIGYVEYDSDLYHRIGQAVGGMGFANSRGDKLLSIEIDRAMDLGNGYQVCQITYLVETTGFDGTVITTNTQKILTHYRDEMGGTYKAVAMASIEGGLA